MAYGDSWWAKSYWWNPLAQLSNTVYNVGSAIKNKDASFLLGQSLGNSAAAPTGIGDVLAMIGGSGSGTSEGASGAAGVNNLLTGNLDYQRQVELMNAEQAFNSAEAQKAHERSVALQENSAALERELRQNQYQDTVTGMRAAGLNPAMMYGGGTAPLVNSAAPVGGSGLRASVGSRSAIHAGTAIPMIAGALISAGALLANSAMAGKFVKAAATRHIGFI